jgi:hypothetical protein
MRVPCAVLEYAVQRSDRAVGAALLRWPAVTVRSRSGEGSRGVSGDETRRNELVWDGVDERSEE